MPLAPPSPPRPPDGSHVPVGGIHLYAEVVGTSVSHPSAGPTTAAQRAAPHGAAVGASMTDFFDDALESAIALVRADGGELAMLDSARHALLLRARSHHPRLTMPSNRPSQPGYLSPREPGQAARRSTPLPLPTGGTLAEQSTMLLPSALSARLIAPGEGLLGLVWQQGHVVALSGDEFRALRHGASPHGADAGWHLGVPILRPGPLVGGRVESTVIGALSVYRRDPLWSFSPADVSTLELHADRIARALHGMDLARQNESRAALLDVLRAAAGNAPDLSGLYPRLRDIVRQLVDAPSFGIMVLNHGRQAPDAFFTLAERDGRPVAAPPRPATALPPWWLEVSRGSVVCVSAPEERAAHPERCQLGWGSEAPVQSLLAAPLNGSPSVFGAIVAGSQIPDAYAPEQVRAFGTVAHAAAIVIENAHLTHVREQALERARENEDRLAELNNAVLTLNASLDLEQTVQALVRQAALFTHARGRMVLLLDEAGTHLVGSASSWVPEGHAPAPEAIRIPLDWQNMRQVLEGEHYAVLDALDQEWSGDSALGHALAAYTIRSCLVLPLEHPHRAHSHPLTGPLKAQPRILGALLVFMPDQRYAFRAREIQLLQALASQSAVAISNAQLYRDLERAYEKQKELDRYKDDFILTVSHEFRTPLTAIDGYVSLISRHGPRLDQQKLDQYGKEIRQATDQLAGMIGTLADVNRMESEPLMLRPQPVNARAAAERALAHLAPEAQARVTLDLAHDLWVLADDERLPRVFGNLVGNALKYTPEGSAIRVFGGEEAREALARRGVAHAALGAAGRWARLGVRDFGPGISPEDQSRLFQKFVRLSHSLTTAVRGTGLGLWICRQYLTAMGGDIWVESALGTGSTFEFCLPLGDAPPEP